MRTFKKIAGFIIVNLIVVVSLTFMLAQPSVLKILLKEAKSEELKSSSSDRRVRCAAGQGV